jgi:selenium-binding protein 1
MFSKFGSRKVIVLGMSLLVLLALTVGVASADGFVRWPVITVDGVDYYWVGAPDGPNGETDVPGHSWVLAGPNKLVGKHFNTGPFGASQWWSSDAPDGGLLYIAQVIIDEWTPEKAEMYASKGYVHYHELISVEGAELHPTKVGWFKHIARTSFNFDRGPRPDLGHEVSQGIDFEFMPNWMNPYNPGGGH